jgi:hypothetical protein
MQQLTFKFTMYTSIQCPTPNHSTHSMSDGATEHLNLSSIISTLKVNTADWHIDDVVSVHPYAVLL